MSTITIQTYWNQAEFDKAKLTLDDLHVGHILYDKHAKECILITDESSVFINKRSCRQFATFKQIHQDFDKLRTVFRTIGHAKAWAIALLTYSLYTRL